MWPHTFGQRLSVRLRRSDVTSDLSLFDLALVAVVLTLSVLHGSRALQLLGSRLRLKPLYAVMHGALRGRTASCRTGKSPEGEDSFV